MSLVDKIKKARETTVEADGKKFTIRRPTEADQADMYAKSASQLELIKRSVVDWNLQEIDIIAGGNPVDVPFTPELFAEYINDHSTLWQPLREAIRAAITAHNAEVERAVKK